MNLEPFPNIPTAPNFVCVTPFTAEIFKAQGLDIWRDCHEPGAGQLFYVMGISFIFLCPSFWGRPAAPSFPDCPSVRKNWWTGEGQNLANYLAYYLIHEMVHFYLGGESLGISTSPPEVYPINDCVALSTFNSIRNPQNYQNYVARRFFCDHTSYTDEANKC